MTSSSSRITRNLERAVQHVLVPTIEDYGSIMLSTFLKLFCVFSWSSAASSFTTIIPLSCTPAYSQSTTSLYMATITEKEANQAINKVATALKKDSQAKKELGVLVKVQNVLGYGSPSTGKVAVRFNASFRKDGMGRASIPLPFGLGQSTDTEGRGVMVGQVKASLVNGKVVECSVFRDLGYGRAFNLKC